MSDATDPVAAAAARLEAAVERLSRAASARPAMPADGAAPGMDASGVDAPGVDAAAVAALAQRLDATIARLRGVLGEEG